MQLSGEAEQEDGSVRQRGQDLVRPDSARSYAQYPGYLQYQSVRLPSPHNSTHSILTNRLQIQILEDSSGRRPTALAKDYGRADRRRSRTDGQGDFGPARYRWSVSGCRPQEGGWRQENCRAHL